MVKVFLVEENCKQSLWKEGGVMKQVKVGVVGLEVNGKSFVRIYAENDKSKLIGVCDPDR